MVQAAFVNRYSRLDRVLHRIGFASGGLQVALADIEDTMYRGALDGIDAARPVFITGLPRAGTTILLNLLYATDAFATHTYRQMPFPLCPLLWQRVTSPFRTREAAMERAHGDGLSVSADSPEAFEEAIWRRFFGKRYRDDRILPWQIEVDMEFEQFMRNHMRKIVWLADAQGGRRYLSKNNQNIARLAYIAERFPDATVIVPYREPLQQAASLLKQHRNFAGEHAADAFSRDYMRAIGHFDFGANLLPIDFDGWFDRRTHSDTMALAFWLEYWAAAYGHVLERHAARVHLVSFERLRASPASRLAELAEAVGLEQSDALVSQHGTIRSAKPHEVDAAGVPDALVDRAREIYDGLAQAENAQSQAASGAATT